MTSVTPFQIKLIDMGARTESKGTEEHEGAEQRG